MKLRKLAFWLHLVAGVVAGTVICVMSVTGVILAFERQIVAFAERHARTVEPPAPGAPRLGPDALVAAATRQAPHWRRISMRLPQPGSHQATVMIEEAQSRHPYPRSILTLDAATAAVVQWEPYEGYNLGRTIRSWVRPVHTGEAGGLLGQIVAALASAGGAVLVYTGLALAWRRFCQLVRRHRQGGRRRHDETRRHDAAREDPSCVSTKSLS
jgi:uncharacterized iron-regulated membrane protein